MTASALIDNNYRAPAKSGAGIGLPNYQADTPPMRGFFVSVARLACYGRAVWGGFGPAGPGTGKTNLHGSLSLIGLRVCELTKRIPGIKAMANTAPVAPKSFLPARYLLVVCKDGSHSFQPLKPNQHLRNHQDLLKDIASGLYFSVESLSEISQACVKELSKRLLEAEKEILGGAA